MGKLTYQKFIEATLERAAKVAQGSFGKVIGTTKPGDNNQVLTETDLKIGKLIIDAISSVYPDHNVIDEEAGVIDRKSELTWVIDPIDGTSSFAAGAPHYGIMVGLLEKEVPVAGGVAMPFFSEIYVASKSNGAYLNGQTISVSTEQSLLSALVAYQIDGQQGQPEMTREECALLAEIILGIRNLRSTNSCFDCMLAAKGKYGACLSRASKIWDNVAMQVIVEEAGGKYTDFWGKPMDYTDAFAKVGENFTFCAASSVLHKQLQDIIQQKVSD